MMKMRALLFLGFWAALTSIGSCDKMEKSAAGHSWQPEQREPISDATRLHVIEDWQQFRKDAGLSMLSAQEKLDVIEAKCADEPAHGKAPWCRLYKSCTHRLDDLKIGILRRGLGFRNRIGEFTAQDVVENQSWCEAFNARLAALHNDLDDGLAMDRQ